MPTKVQPQCTLACGDVEIWVENMSEALAQPLRGLQFVNSTNRKDEVIFSSAGKLCIVGLRTGLRNIRRTVPEIVLEDCTKIVQTVGGGDITGFAIMSQRAFEKKNEL